MLPPDVIAGLKGFLARVELRGQEVPAFNKIMYALQVEEQGIARAQASAGSIGAGGAGLPLVPPSPTANGAAESH